MFSCVAVNAVPSILNIEVSISMHVKFEILSFNLGHDYISYNIEIWLLPSKKFNDFNKGMFSKLSDSKVFSL